jgi:tRNA (guanine37-N1)-methyltransferase
VARKKADSPGGRDRSGRRGAGARKRGPALRIEILTLFPGIFESPFSHSLIGKAQARGLLAIGVNDIRVHARGRHRVADDAPYGGGDGMVMKPEPVVRAIEEAAGPKRRRRAWVVLFSPAGALLTQAKARELAARKHVVLVCGRYAGVDERVAASVDEEISVGDYVLGGGEPAAIVLVDAVARLVPGVVGNEVSPLADSFEDGLLECPQYTRPPVFRGLEVPRVLLGGDHEEVARWRRKESLRRTWGRRPDLLSRAALTQADHIALAKIRREVTEARDGPGTGGEETAAATRRAGARRGTERRR